jgi:hypothetical protein
MKKIRALIITMLFAAFASPLAAQPSHSSSANTAFATNYLLTVKLTRPDKPPAKITDVFAAPDVAFDVSPLMVFKGTASEKNGRLLLRYYIRLQKNVRRGKDAYAVNRTLNATVRLKLDTPLVIFKGPDETVSIKTSRLKESE